MQKYDMKEALSPDTLTKKVFKFGDLKVWIKTLARDDHKTDEWGLVAETTPNKYQGLLVFNALKDDGWKVMEY